MVHLLIPDVDECSEDPGQCDEFQNKYFAFKLRTKGLKFISVRVGVASRTKVTGTSLGYYYGIENDPACREKVKGHSMKKVFLL